ncbi:MAG TPA: MarR family winged helix-turn-helix transcriptional regulator [Thermoleophilaceae bacterium]|jgi:DNA-binding MarR family transcriptional regulator|nr:MarR family winged helix-turn-helix transcriptional regulator [Thermoleophilaceae bacterium]
MSTEPIAQALERLELAGAYHRAARARQIGVPQIELAALEHLEASGGLTPGELGHRLGLTSGGVTALTGRLVDAGYIARDRHPDDGRMRVLTLSPVGTARLREHMAPVREPVDEGLAALPAADAELLTDLLDRLAAGREVAAAATPGPERIYPTDGYTRALLM